MNSRKKSRSLQDINKERQKLAFVGRTEQLDLFRRNLQIPDDSRCFIFSVWGQGGVGKTTLLQQFRKIAEEANIATARADDTERSVPEVLGRFAEQLKEKGHKLGQFAERYKVYRQKKQELETDPDAPQGFSAFVGKSLAKAGVKLGRRIPVAGMAMDFVDEDAFSTQAGEWTTYLAKKLTNKDEVRLIQEPEAVLTPLFLQEINNITEKTKIALFFDTYERTDDFLDRWLREIMEGRYGDVSSEILWIIAGRQGLDENLWMEYEGLIARFPLDIFTEEEAKHYLSRKGITNNRVIEVILRLSGRLPLLLATLAVESPNDPDKVGDPSGTAVERFLKWVDDPRRRRIALDAALPRDLNRDILAQLSGEEEAEELFEWLKTMPFVQEQNQYHEVVRTQMLRQKRLTSPQDWATLHGKLANYYDSLRQGLELNEDKQPRDPTWQKHTLEVLYHRLCQAPQKHLPVALNEFLAALKEQYDFAQKWAEAMEQAGKDAEVEGVQRWGERLVEGLIAYDEDRYEVTVSIFAELLKCSDIKERWQAVAFAWRGKTYRLMERYEDALKDFNKAIELDSEYRWSLAQRGETYRLMERYDEALQDFTRAIELDPEYDWAFASRGLTYRLMKRYDEALQDFTRAIELDPESDWALASRGVTYRWMKCYEDALKDFNRAIELDPESDRKLASRGLTYRLMKRYDEALQDFNRAIELDSGYAWSIANRGLTYRLMKRYDEALQDFNRAIELDPELSWSIRERGETYRLMKRYDEALQDFTRAIELDPESDWKLANRGLTYRSMECYEDALKDFNRAIELDPKSAGALALRGDTYRLMERYEDALKDFNKAIELNPEYKWAISHRGKTYRLMKRYEEALQDFDKSIELDPKYAWAIAQRGLTYRLMERYEAALQDFNRAIDLDPKYKWALAHRGQTYRLMKRYEDALQDFDKAIQLNPKYDWVIAQRGETYLILQRYTEALADFNRAIELDTDNDWRLYDRALTYKALKQPENAQIDLNRAIQLAQQTYNENPENSRNTLNLALYFLAAGNSQQAKHFYRDAIKRGKSPEPIQMAIRDLDDFLRIFPQHPGATAAKQTLQNLKVE